MISLATSLSTAHQELKSTIDNFLDSDPEEDMDLQGTKPETDNEEFTLTRDVENYKFVLVGKTLASCMACKRFDHGKNILMSILPSNVTYEEIILNRLSDTEKVQFMSGRGGDVVPSVFILTENSWSKYKKGELPNEKLSIDVVSKIIGIPVPLDIPAFKRWLSDSMHRLYLYETAQHINASDEMIILDTEFPLVKFNNLPDVDTPKHRFGKAFYVSSKCNKKRCQRGDPTPG